MLLNLIIFVNEIIFSVEYSKIVIFNFSPTLHELLILNKTLFSFIVFGKIFKLKTN